MIRNLNLLLGFSFFIISFAAYSEIVTDEDLVVRENIVYKRFTDLPFTGKKETIYKAILMEKIQKFYKAILIEKIEKKYKAILRGGRKGRHRPLFSPPRASASRRGTFPAAGP